MLYEERLSDSPYVEFIMRGYTTTPKEVIRPSDIHWHMVLAHVEGRTQVVVAGPLSCSGLVKFIPGVELLWIKFKVGTFMPHLPLQQCRDLEISLPEASSNRLWLKSSVWELPNYENADTFIHRLIHDEILVHDPLVPAVLAGQPTDLSERTLRFRFAQAAGLTQKHIHQYERALRAAMLLDQGMPILDTLDELGYFDQAHLTRSLKRFLGITPAKRYKPSC